MLREEFELIPATILKNAKWVIREIYSACDCFSCKNKIEHKFVEFKVSIYCRDPCNYKPRRTDTFPDGKVCYMAVSPTIS
jgi:Zn finger protein HypA/HybF involved in hydrogenase expression